MYWQMKGGRVGGGSEGTTLDTDSRTLDTDSRTVHTDSLTFHTDSQTSQVVEY